MSHELLQPNQLYVKHLILTDPTHLIHLSRERLSGREEQIGYDQNRDIHIVGAHTSGEPIVFVANGGDISMNEFDVLAELERDGTSEIQEQGDRTDGPILYPQSRPGDTLVYAEYGADSPDQTYNAKLLQLIREGYECIGIALADDIHPVPSMTNFLEQEKPPTYAPHVLSPRALGQDSWQAMLHMGMYTKTGIEQMCAANNPRIPTPPTYNYPMNCDAQDTAAALYEKFPGYSDLVISKQTGCSGEGVYFVGKDGVANLLSSKFTDQELMMVQGRIPKKHIMNSPCFRAYIGDDGAIPIGVTAQRLVDGRYSGNMWFQGIEQYLEELSPGFLEVNTEALKMMQHVGVRGVVNIDYMLVTPEAVQEYGLPNTTLLRELNARPAFSHPIGTIAKGSINGLPIDQVQTNFSVTTPDNLYYRDDLLEVLNTFATPDMQVFMGLRYPSWIDADPGRSYIVFAGNGNVSREEMDQVHNQTERLIQSFH